MEALPPPQERDQRPGDLDLNGDCPEAPRSILIVSWDTARMDHLSLYGGRAEVPNLEALASSGARFDQAVSHYPETAVSHWTMLTGAPPAAHGEVPAAGGSRYRGPTIAEIAASCGYATGAFIGGVTLAARSAGLDRGFEHYDDHFAWQSGALKRPASEITFRAKELIAQQDGPWLAFVHYFDAHSPYQPPPPWDRAYDPDYSGLMDGSEAALSPHWTLGDPAPAPRDLEHAVALYDGELAYLDTWLPELLGVSEGAVVALTSDHGESFEHDYWFNHRESLWDSTMRVPLVLRAPEIAPETTIDAQVGLVDLAPTLLELAGLPLDEKMLGRSLTGLIRGEGGGRDLVWASTEAGVGRLAARTNAGKAIWSGEALAHSYDLAADPGERTELGEVPSAIDETPADYLRQVEALAPLQRSLERRSLSGAELQNLESLGYVEPGRGGADAAGPRDGQAPAPQPEPPPPDRSPPDRSGGPPEVP